MPYDEATKEIIASRIRSERKRAGLTQIELAEKLGVSEKTIKNFEKSGPDKIVDLVALSKLFRCSIDYLLGNAPCRLHENTDILFATGLSEKSIEKVKKYTFDPESNCKEDFSNWMNDFIESDEFDQIIAILEKLLFLDFKDVDMSSYNKLEKLLQNYNQALPYYPIGSFHVIADSDLAKDIEIQNAADIFKMYLKQYWQYWEKNLIKNKSTKNQQD